MSRCSNSTKAGSNRRSFLRTIAAAAFGFSVLPPATTYNRVWRATREPVRLVTLWTQTQRAAICVDAGYERALEKAIGKRILKSETFELQFPVDTKLVEGFTRDENGVDVPNGISFLWSK